MFHRSSKGHESPGLFSSASMRTPKPSQVGMSYLHHGSSSNAFPTSHSQLLLPRLAQAVGAEGHASAAAPAATRHHAAPMAGLSCSPGIAVPGSASAGGLHHPPFETVWVAGRDVRLRSGRNNNMMYLSTGGRFESGRDGALVVAPRRERGPPSPPSPPPPSPPGYAGAVVDDHLLHMQR